MKVEKICYKMDMTNLVCRGRGGGCIKFENLGLLLLAYIAWGTFESPPGRLGGVNDQTWLASWYRVVSINQSPLHIDVTMVGQ